LISVGNSFLILDLYRTTLPSRAAILCRDDCLIDLQLTREWAVEQVRKGKKVSIHDFGL
jgi:hypothetical protein